MKVFFDKLFSVHFQHDYFSNQRFTGFKIAPSVQSIHQMKRYGLLYKPAADGFSIIYETPFAGTERTRETLMNSDITLGFRIDITDPYFFNYTDLIINENISDRLFLFGMDLNGREPNADASLLHRNASVTEMDMVPANASLWLGDTSYEQLSFTKPFGYVYLQLQGQQEKNYYIRFAKKNTFWKYILSSDHLQQWSNPLIINKNTKEKFTGPDLVQLPDGRTVNAFTSVQPVALSESANQSFQLGDDYDIITGRFKTEIINTLPNPNIRLISKISLLHDVENGGNNVIKNNISFILI